MFFVGKNTFRQNIKMAAPPYMNTHLLRKLERYTPALSGMSGEGGKSGRRDSKKGALCLTLQCIYTNYRK
jgi:hypothetical protein